MQYEKIAFIRAANFDKGKNEQLYKLNKWYKHDNTSAALCQKNKNGGKNMINLELNQKRAQEKIKHNLLGEMYFWLLNNGKIKETAMQIETYEKLETAVKNGSSPNVILDLAVDLSCVECESAFKLGFQFAMKILKEGEADIYA